MSDAILVLNAGSSSIKYAVYEHSGGRLSERLSGHVGGVAVSDTPSTLHAHYPDHAGCDLHLGHGVNHHAALEAVLDQVRGSLGGLTLRGVGHRIVHGGRRYSAPVQIDAAVLDDLRELESLAPLHQPHNLAAVEACRQLAPDLVQIACFDTAFHRSQPPVAQRFALPREYERRGVIRYGFHGLSYQRIATLLPDYDLQAAQGRTVVAHLGSGASLCALHAGKSVATTMGFTALDGLPMGQRCGNIDPGVVLHLQRIEGLSVAQVEQLLYRESGLLGVSGISADMRKLLKSSEPSAEEAVELFCYRIQREVGSLAAALGGVDALVFTAGIGEHCAPVRERIVNGLGWLGMDLDQVANRGDGPRITTAQSAISGWVIPTDEERVIAAHTARLLSDD